jgi:hypothetical protein
MSLERIKKQLLRDIKKSPAKAASLGALTLVAVYFWAPLAMSWLGGGTKAPTTDAAQIVLPITQVAPPIAPQIGAAQVPAGPPWQQRVEWMASDPNMQPAELAAEASSPFQGSVVQSPHDVEPAGGSIGVASQVGTRLEPLGLKLSSILVGKQRRVAVINGRPYAEGREIAAENDRVFKVAKVAERHVVLERNGQRFELAIADSNLSGENPQTEFDRQ